jgi:exopolyphosphatase / guanosine-5'-triphosphate,3'-diphosphate pyrophosphatase
MLASSIDIGTNTTLALLAEDSEDGLVTVHDQITPNLLGEALRTSRELSKDVIELNVDLLNEIVRDHGREGAEAFAVCGTSALRAATNRSDFVRAVREIVGLNVEIISGQTEAELTFAGAISGREIYPHERVGVIDLGGGSTEIIRGQGHVPGQSFSLDTGAVYLANDFFVDDPPGPESITRLREGAREKIKALIGAIVGLDAPWIAVGGTVVSLAIFKNGLRTYNPIAVGGTFLDRDDIEQFAARMTGKTSIELQNWPGMPPGRGRSILAGTLLLSELFDSLSIKEVVVSERGLRHGFWLAKFGRKHA